VEKKVISRIVGILGKKKHKGNPFWGLTSFGKEGVKYKAAPKPLGSQQYGTRREVPWLPRAEETATEEYQKRNRINSNKRKTKEPLLKPAKRKSGNTNSQESSTIKEPRIGPLGGG